MTSVPNFDISAVSLQRRVMRGRNVSVLWDATAELTGWGGGELLST
jgi:hypothetical protein